MQDWITQLFSDQEQLRMGHHQRKDDLNLGLGWLYYALTRIVRPRHAVVIGSWRGFVPLLIGKAMQDNVEKGEVTFIDPSLADGFWRDPGSVQRHFQSHGVENIRHFLMTTQEFVSTPEYPDINGIGILFIDGFHSAEQAQFDFEAFQGRLDRNGLALFHDSVGSRVSHRYGPENTYRCTVSDYIDELRKQPQFQVLDLPFGAGVTAVRRIG